MFKKWFSLFIAVMLLAVLPALAETQYAHVQTPTKDGTVFVRKSASASSAKLGYADNGDQLIVLERGNAWHKVQLVKNGLTGWMSGSYVRMDAVGTDVNQGGKVSSTAGYANFRTGPGTRYALIRKLNNGTKLNVLSKSGSWYYVQTVSAKEYGYISASLVKLDSAPAAEAWTVSSSDGFANLRKGPSMNSGIVCPLYNGTEVNVTGTSGSWSRVEVPSTNQYGYVSTHLLKKGSSPKPQPTPTPAPAEVLRTVRIRSNDGFANLRSGAGTDKSVIAKLNNGVMVSVIGSSGNWYRVQLTDRGAVGYVYKTLTEDVPVLAVKKATGDVNMRTGPGTDYAKKYVVKKGTTVSVLGDYGKFAYVNADGWYGYVSNSYLK